MLGMPDEEADSELSYLLGDERGLIKLDSEYLSVKLTDGIVVAAEVTG